MIPAIRSATSRSIWPTPRKHHGLSMPSCAPMGRSCFRSSCPGPANAPFQGYVNTVPMVLTVGNGLAQRRFLDRRAGRSHLRRRRPSGIGEPLSGVVVQAVGTDGTEYSATTDSNGRGHPDRDLARRRVLGDGGGRRLHRGHGFRSEPGGGAVPAGRGPRCRNGCDDPRDRDRSGGGRGRGRRLCRRRCSAAATATTDGSGAYTLIGLPGDTYQVDVSASGLTEALTAGVDVADGGSVQEWTSTWPLPAVSAASSRRWPTARRRAGGATFQSGENTFGTATAADGTFSVANLPPGTYAITTLSNPFMSATGTVTVTAGATSAVTLSVAPRGRQRHGHCFGRGGRFPASSSMLPTAAARSRRR